MNTANEKSLLYVSAPSKLTTLRPSSLLRMVQNISVLWVASIKSCKLEVDFIRVLHGRNGWCCCYSPQPHLSWGSFLQHLKDGCEGLHQSFKGAASRHRWRAFECFHVHYETPDWWIHFKASSSNASVLPFFKKWAFILLGKKNACLCHLIVCDRRASSFCCCNIWVSIDNVTDFVWCNISLEARLNHWQFKKLLYLNGKIVYMPSSLWTDVCSNSLWSLCNGRSGNAALWSPPHGTFHGSSRRKRKHFYCPSCCSFILNALPSSWIIYPQHSQSICYKKHTFFHL